MAEQLIAGVITRGTTLEGKTLNAGDRVELPSHLFHKFSLTKDIEPASDCPPSSVLCPQQPPAPSSDSAQVSRKLRK